MLLLLRNDYFTMLTYQLIRKLVYLFRLLTCCFSDFYKEVMMIMTLTMMNRRACRRASRVTEPQSVVQAE